MMKCKKKHVAYQPTDEEFNCPKCGTKCGDFHLIIQFDDSDMDCDLIHADDYIECDGCGFSISASRFAKDIQITKNLVPCGHCKGTGLVNGECENA